VFGVCAVAVVPALFLPRRPAVAPPARAAATPLELEHVLVIHVERPVARAVGSATVSRWDEGD
jgi:hypothetical protein